MVRIWMGCIQFGPGPESSFGIRIRTWVQLLKKISAKSWNFALIGEILLSTFYVQNLLMFSRNFIFLQNLVIPAKF